MTRSLSSNLIKYNYVNYDKTEKIVIDSDAKLPFFKPLNFENLDVVQVPQNTSESESQDFVAGIQAIPVSQMEEINLEDKQREAQEIIDNAKAEAETIIAQANKEAAQLKEDAENAGYQEGYEAGKAEVGKLQEDLKLQINDNAKEYQKIIQSIEPKYTNIMIKLLERMTGVISSEYKSVIVHLIQKSLEENDNEENYTIRVSREDYDAVKKKIDSIKAMLKETAVVELVIDSKLEKSQCFIETDTSVIDCSLDVQLENLVVDLRLLAGI